VLVSTTSTGRLFHITFRGTLDVGAMVRAPKAPHCPRKLQLSGSPEMFFSWQRLLTPK